MDKKRVYCHTTYFDYNFEGFFEGSWYEIYNETNDFYTIKHFIFSIKNTEYKTYEYKTYDLFSDYFYTEQEYNREKNLDKLLSEDDR